MTDAELLKHFETYLIVTRPEAQPKQQRKEQTMLTLNPQLAKGMALAKANGIDIDLSILARRKK